MTDPMSHDTIDAASMLDDEAGRIPPPASDSGNAAQSEAESFEEETRKQLNLLRERTFNPELRQLVDRVRENEPASGIFDGEADDSEDGLRLQLYRLYYRARVLHDNREINTSFNPFESFDGSSPDSIPDSVADYIVERMRRLSLSPFALLSYSIIDKGFKPTLHNLDRYRVENIIISLRDRLFKSILDYPEGIIIEPDALRDDPFMEKVFDLREGEDPRALYFVQIGSLVSDPAQELQESGRPPINPFLPSAILMIELPQQTEPHNLGSIFSGLRKKLAMPFFLLNDNQSLVFTSENYEDLDFSYHVLDYLFSIFMLSNDRIGISLKTASNGNGSKTFLMKYIISQLSHRLHADSVLVHIIKGQLIILTRDAYVDSVYSLIGEYNKLFADQFTVVEFHPGEFRDSLEIIRRIVLKN